jgi:hypothetical protein
MAGASRADGPETPYAYTLTAIRSTTLRIILICAMRRKSEQVVSNLLDAAEG